MKKTIKGSIAIIVALLISSIQCFNLTVCAADSSKENIFYIGNTVNTGHDTGFSKNDKITEDDPHFGWKIGKFYISGYTRIKNSENENPIFLKTVGDTVTLWFELEQNIDKLNDNEELSICDDTNGYDEYFGIEKTDFGKGALIIRHTDYQNHTGEPIIYTDYLSANAKTNEAIKVELCEEGDYEVALDYEISKTNFNIFGWKPLPSYRNYKVFFKFSVRNGNCMVYPFDVKTGDELTNSSITENGFYLDLAKSRYLNIDIQKQIRKDGAEGLTEDVRFNKPAKDGEKYTDEGIYTITVKNIYTDQTTTKVIYVGTDDVLKAHVATGLSIADVEHQLALGGKVAEDGTLITASNETLPVIEETNPTDISSLNENPNNLPTMNKNGNSNKNTTKYIWLYISVGVIVIVAIIITFMLVRKKKNSKNCNDIFSNSDGNIKK